MCYTRASPLKPPNKYFTNGVIVLDQQRPSIRCDLRALPQEFPYNPRIRGITVASTFSPPQELYPCVI